MGETGGYSLLDSYETKIDEIKQYYIQFQLKFLEEIYFIKFKEKIYNRFDDYFRKGIKLIMLKRYDLIKLAFQYKLVSNVSVFIEDHFNDLIPRCFNQHSTIRKALNRNDDDNVLLFSISKKRCFTLISHQCY